MSIFNRKEIETAYTCAEENKEDSISKTKSTGAKGTIAYIALTGVLLGIVPVGLCHDCKTQDPTEETCFFTELNTKLFGYEAGLKHQYKDLLAYKSDDFELSDVEYSEPHAVYTIPEGYVLQDGKGISVVEPTPHKIINDDGTVGTFYTLPEGYVLKLDEDGNLYGESIVSPERQDLNASISYVKTETNGITTDEMWSYDDYAITHEVSEEPISVLKLKR